MEPQRYNIQQIIREVDEKLYADHLKRQMIHRIIDEVPIEHLLNYFNFEVEEGCGFGGEKEIIYKMNIKI